MDDDVVGYHAQQAVEKAIKAVLVLCGIDFPRTHDLDFLLARGRRRMDSTAKVSSRTRNG